MKAMLPILLLCICQAALADPTPSPRFQCPKEGGLFPDPDDCTKYFQCFNLLAWEMQCPAGLSFDRNAFVCDYEYNVHCKKSVGNLMDPTPSPSSSARQKRDSTRLRATALSFTSA